MTSPHHCYRSPHENRSTKPYPIDIHIVVRLLTPTFPLLGLLSCLARFVRRHRRYTVACSKTWLRIQLSRLSSIAIRICGPISLPEDIQPTMSSEMSGEQMQAKIAAARRDAEGLKDKIKRKKEELADTSCKLPWNDSKNLPFSAKNRRIMDF